MAALIYNETYCTKAIAVLSNGESLVAVAAELGVSRQTVYEWKVKHPEFNEAVQIGLARSQRYWERMGHDGTIGYNKDFSATPWVFTMKSRFREDYAEEKEKSNSDSLVEKLIDKLID